MKIFQKMKDFFVRIFWISGFLRILISCPNFLFLFFLKFIYFLFYFWVFLLKSAQQILSQFSKIPKVNVLGRISGFFRFYPDFCGFIRFYPDFNFLSQFFFEKK